MRSFYNPDWREDSEENHIGDSERELTQRRRRCLMQGLVMVEVLGAGLGRGGGASAGLGDDAGGGLGGGSGEGLGGGLVDSEKEVGLVVEQSCRQWRS